MIAVACISAYSFSAEAQETETSSATVITESGQTVGPGKEYSPGKADNTAYKSSQQNERVLVWADGGKFLDPNSISYVDSPAIFQVGGSAVGGTEANGHGGLIQFDTFETRGSSRTPDLSVFVLGSSEADSVFHSSSFSTIDGAGKSVDLYLNGGNHDKSTLLEVDSSFYLQRNPLDSGGRYSFTLQNSAALKVRSDALFVLNGPEDQFIVRNSTSTEEKQRGLIVGGALYIYNNASPPQDLSAKSEQAIIENSSVQAGGQFALVAGSKFKAGKTSFLQVVNSTISAPEVHVYSVTPGNTATLLLGHGTKVKASEFVFVFSSKQSGAHLMLGDTTSLDADYGITTPCVAMGGWKVEEEEVYGREVINLAVEGLALRGEAPEEGDSRIIFNNAHRGDSAETASFSITGYGTVDVLTGRTIFSKESTYAGETNIRKDSTLILKTISSAGTSNVNNNGELRFSGAHGALQNKITGSGAVVFEDDARISMPDDAAWSGPTSLKKAIVLLGSYEKPIRVSSSSVTVSSEGELYGFGSLDGSLNNAGFFMNGDSENTSAVDFSVGRDVVNSGLIVLGSGKNVGNTLTVNGSYSGDSGHLVFYSVLNGDNSPTDKLFIKGDTSGSTQVEVNNFGGKGRQTGTGIELIHVEGNSNGVFAQEGRIVAGAYDYKLERGTGENSKNWYLKSHLTIPKNKGGKSVPTEPTEDIPLYRPEAGAYVGNSAVVQALFSSHLHDRIGDLWYADPYSENNQLTGMWVKQRGNYNTWRESSGQTRNRTQMYATQIGADVASWTSNGENRFLVGWVAGYGHGRTKSRSIHSGHHAIGTVDGLNVGLTGTWYQDGFYHEGIYIDTWLTYGWFDNKVKGEGLKTEKYHSRGFTGSLETGYTWKLSEYTTEKGCDIGWFLQPQAQVIWSGVRTDTFHEHNGTRVKSKGRNNIQTRVGARLLFDTNVHSYAKGIGGTQLFIEGNWVHNTKNHGVEMDGTVLNQEGARHLGELKLGLNGKPTDNLHIWTNVTVRAGTHRYRDLTGMIGLKYCY